uniref:Rab interacting lysosomal protein n=1 Tax=Terrapene triunguis TaxID=2587831 RepID=A0A674IXM1_9SAUR
RPPLRAAPRGRDGAGAGARAHVYRMAGALGAELQRLSGRFGPEAVAGLVPQVVRLLELLEALAGPAGAESVAMSVSMELRRRAELQLISWCWVLDSTLRKEREVMLRLKEVVDKQRDEIRAQAHEIVCKNHDTEALQEQLNRFMSMNEDLRHKLAVVQVQLKSSLEKKEDLETMDGAAAPVEELQHQDWGRNSAPSCFCKEELKQILQERNELKTSLFLVQEELAYYQRELLNDERIPSFLLDAMKSTIKKQRKKIRAKMLGTVEEPASRGDSWLGGETHRGEGRSQHPNITAHDGRKHHSAHGD